jgi:pectinesterase
VTEVGPHAFAVFGRGNRLVLQNCDVLSKGADTIASWKNGANGMYYYANLKVTGCVDFVCPRGWAYMKDSTLTELKNTAAMWHQGVNDQDKKFVIRNCNFDGVKDWQLGRHHYDACFYFIDCTFDQNMRDTPLARTKGDQTFKYAEDRHYYYNCHRTGGDYAWFKDNLDKSPGSPKPQDITAAWTFGGKWDPESDVAPKVVSVAAKPSKTVSEDSLGEAFDMELTFSEAVTVKGKPSAIQGNGRHAPYVSGSGTSKLVFSGIGKDKTLTSLDLSKGALLACRASAMPRFVTETALPK